ncbi:MAG TPA: PASTA domain-containing protein, partial [Fimbriimonas sp.]|nr:PASTA domain-containing protein [Fimbriimonas sp.]
VNHPLVENISEILEDAGQHYLISDVPKGSSMVERVKRFAPFSVPVALASIVGLTEAIDAIHMAGFAHGDIGPHNIVATHDGVSKVQMAGLWQAYASSRTAGVAVLGQMAPYLAPEVCAGARPSMLSDIYSIGVVFFELLTGKVPFVGETPAATAARHATSPVPSLRGINASIPVALDHLVQRLLSKDPTQRPQTAKELLHELRSLADQLRFGLNAPVKQPTVAAEVPDPKADLPTVKPERRSARKEKAEKPEPEAKKKKQKKERDVPGWMLGFLGLLVLGVVGCVIALLLFLAQKPRDVKVPNLKGAITKSAIEQVKPLKLNIRVVGRESNERMQIGQILRTRPEAGQFIREGGTIEVVESAGTRMVKVPDLRGFTADEARLALEAENLRVDGRPSRIIDPDNPPGAIIRQLPEQGQTVPRTSKIRVWIAAPADAPQGSLPGESDDPSPNPARSFQVKHKINGVSWRVTVKVEMTDDTGTKVVHEKDYGSDDEFSLREIGYGKKATFKIYYDGELKDTVEVLAGSRSLR